MRLVVFPDARRFLERAEPFFLADEARHHLPFGLSRLLAKSQTADSGAVFCASIETERQVIACAVRAGANLILAPAV